MAPGGRSSGGNANSGASSIVSSSNPPLKIILSVGLSFRSILLISASNLSSCERNARNTLHTAAKRSLSSNADEGSTPAGHGDRKDDITVLFARGLSHRAANGLYDIDVRVTRTHEQHCVQRGYVDALREAPCVRENATGAVGVSLQPLNPGLCGPARDAARRRDAFRTGRRVVVPRPVSRSIACPTMSSQWVSRRWEDLMVLVNAIARPSGRIGPSPFRLFSGFCNARQHPTILAASVRLISLPLDAR